ncbi:helix-turn-helix domain-containing protein [Mycobacterium sp. URHB0021]
MLDSKLQHSSSLRTVTGASSADMIQPNPLGFSARSDEMAESRVARDYGVSQSWISRLVARYKAEGEKAFQPRSRRPRTSPTRLPQSTIDLITDLRGELRGKGLDHGPHTIAWHLQHHHHLIVSAATISRHLHAAGLVQASPQQRPRRCRRHHRRNSDEHRPRIGIPASAGLCRPHRDDRRHHEQVHQRTGKSCPRTPRG